MNEGEGQLPEYVRHEKVIETPQRIHALPIVDIGKMKGATPSVSNLTIFKGSNTGPVTVTQFMNGQEGQVISILGDGNMTIANGALIKTNNGINKLLLINKIYRFTRISNVWYEDL
jgi:hypothetical protein